ncbi:hypothetical protein LTR60_004337 [Cryomyces antarcticus]|nr:hypothetical protein LTR60_004337 [Cryomyces antarcticus]
MIWEARLDRTQKPGPQSTREQRLRFITSKYAEKAFVQPISATLSHFSTAEETLLASIKKNDIQNVLYALALRASPNATDRSRNTHAVFLALAAADPASPAPSASYGSSPPSMAKSSPRAEAATQPRKPFPIAEILLQNGADLPSLPAPIPLSRAAQLYLDYKIDQRTGRHLDIGARDVNGDILTALPSIVAGNGSTPGERARERDKMLLKRRSDGTGRTAIINAFVLDNVAVEGAFVACLRNRYPVGTRAAKSEFGVRRGYHKVVGTSDSSGYGECGGG